MNRIMKKSLGAILSAALSASLLLGNAGYALAATDTEEAKLTSDEKRVTGSSTVSSTAGRSTTTTEIGTANVTGKYSYVNTSTLETNTISSSSGGMGSAQVSFSAPSGCRSVKMVGSHRVSLLSQTWTATTTAVL